MACTGKRQASDEPDPERPHGCQRRRCRCDLSEIKRLLFDTIRKDEQSILRKTKEN